MDNNAKLWDVETGQEIGSLQGHTAEIVSLHFNTEGDKILTGSFDTTAKVGSNSSRSGISEMERVCRPSVVTQASSPALSLILLATTA